MGKNLMKQDEQGNWCLEGVKWRDLYTGSVITPETYEKLYGALAKLKDYENTGLMPDEVDNLANLLSNK